MSQSTGSGLLSHPKQAFDYWVQERELVRTRKEMELPKPWSDDRVFQTTYFCNVRREDDKVTRWIRASFDLAPIHAPLSMIVARLVNKPESLAAMNWPWVKLDRDAWFEVMSKPGAWGSAYIVSTNGRAMPKHEYIWGLLEAARTALRQLPPATLAGTLARAHEGLQAVPGLASFMAAQVVADLKNTQDHPLQSAEDWYTFAAPSGAAAGCLEELCNQDLQNCFCEFDKYMRVATNTGRSKRKYAGA